MTVSIETQQLLTTALCDVAGAQEIVTILNAAAAGQAIAPSAPVVPVAITWTANAATYVADGTLTIADGTTPTVVELQSLCLELKRNITSLQAILHTHGLTT